MEIVYVQSQSYSIIVTVQRFRVQRFRVPTLERGNQIKLLYYSKEQEKESFLC